MSLVGCLEGLLFGFPCHPLAVYEQGDNAEAHEKDNAKHQDYAGLSACPVSSLCEGGQAVCLGAGTHGDCRHLGPKLRMKMWGFLREVLAIHTLG